MREHKDDDDLSQCFHDQMTQNSFTYGSALTTNYST